MVAPNTCSKGVCGQLFTAPMAWSQIPNGNRHWLGRGQVGTDSGKRLFSHQRVVTNAISSEHLCLWKINGTTTTTFRPSGGPDLWDPSIPWLQVETRGPAHSQQ